MRSAEAVQLAAQAQLEVESLNNLGLAFDDAFAFLEDQAPASSNLLQINNLVVTESESESESSDSDSSSSDSESDDEHIMIRDDVDHTMDCTSNNKDNGISFGTMMDEYTGADNDDFMKRIVDDFGTK